jgi:hypothetical protein
VDNNRLRTKLKACGWKRNKIRYYINHCLADFYPTLESLKRSMNKK